MTDGRDRHQVSGAFSSSGRAPDLQSGGSRFETGRVHHFPLISPKSPTWSWRWFETPVMSVQFAPSAPRSRRCRYQVRSPCDGVAQMQDGADCRVCRERSYVGCSRAVQAERCGRFYREFESRHPTQSQVSYCPCHVRRQKRWPSSRPVM